MFVSRGVNFASVQFSSFFVDLISRSGGMSSMISVKEVLPYRTKYLFRADLITLILQKFAKFAIFNPRVILSASKSYLANIDK